jgi:hypothetical protein
MLLGLFESVGVCPAFFLQQFVALDDFPEGVGFRSRRAWMQRVKEQGLI